MMREKDAYQMMNELEENGVDMREELKEAAKEMPEMAKPWKKQRKDFPVRISNPTEQSIESFIKMKGTGKRIVIGERPNHSCFPVLIICHKRSVGTYFP